ncbi:hypothetical protein Cgig2_005506 [Carnegiea gigantea]|uniref:RING-type domain-containing protein n=1 Tax=Carnegiea gigantea TaxID=171969 RepID=A0A9Q1GNT1_9CARY|nr:hypothetical protein Cgig2_005506 [Carnegiea gigantea]
MGGGGGRRVWWWFEGVEEDLRVPVAVKVGRWSAGGGDLGVVVNGGGSRPLGGRDTRAFGRLGIATQLVAPIHHRLSATKLYCFVHKVPVCGECICFPEHQICVVRTYSEWVIDGEYDWPPNCCKCNGVLEEGTDPQTTRLGCLHVIHANCLISHIKSFPPHTAPAGYVCPACSTSNPSKFIQDALVPIKGVLISDVLTNQADLDAQISLAFCLFELIRIITPNSPFEDELMKKAFLVIVSSFQALPDSADKSYHKGARRLESISKVKSYVVLLDLECDDFILDIFHNPLVSIKDEHPSLMLAHIESILVGILDEADDLLLEFLISMLSRSQAMGGPSSTAQAMSKRILEICASWIPLQQIISSINESMHSKEKEGKEVWPPKNFKDLGSRLHSKLKEAIMQTGIEKNVFGNHPVAMSVPENRGGHPPAFASEPLRHLSGAGGTEGMKSEANVTEGFSSGAGAGSSRAATHDIVETDGSSQATSLSVSHEPNYIKAGSPASAGATTRKGAVHIDRQNSEGSYFADDEDANRKKYSRRGQGFNPTACKGCLSCLPPGKWGPFRHKFLRALLPFWSSALPTLPVTAPPRKDSVNADDVPEGRVRHQRSSRMDPRKILLFIAIMACMATMGILYYRISQGGIGLDMPNDEQ